MDEFNAVSNKSTEPVTKYSFSNLILMFFIFAFTGWVWEVIYIAFTEGVIAKRGMLHGPWLPIYGVGGILILLLLGRFQEHPAAVFVLAMLLCGTMEYLTGMAVEAIFQCRWWDYSDKFLNINGRICLEGVLLFGAAGMSAVCKFAPMLQELIKRLGREQHLLIAVILVAAFIFDIGFSMLYPNIGEGVTYELLESVQ